VSYSCLWCPIVSARPEDITLCYRQRSFTLKQYYAKYIADGERDVKHAKMHNNIIELAIINIPLDQVIYMYQKNAHALTRSAEAGLLS